MRAVAVAEGFVTAAVVIAAFKMIRFWNKTTVLVAAVPFRWTVNKESNGRNESLCNENNMGGDRNQRRTHAIIPQVFLG